MSKRKQDILTLVLSLLIVLLVNYIGSYVFTRFDLTANNRYTLSEETIEQVEDLEDIVYFKVYLEGDFPADIERLRDATKQLLDDLRAYQADNIQYEFINPSSATDRQKRKEQYERLREKGLEPTVLPIRTKSSREEKIIFPGAMVSYKGNEVALQLLKSQNRAPTSKMIGNSIDNLEYEIANAIRRVTRDQKPRIAFIEGHGELAHKYVADFAQTLEEQYAVDRVELKGQLGALKGYDGAVVAKPRSKFSTGDKFILDQFIMRGGRVMWLVDPMRVSTDSLKKKETTMALPQELDLSDQLFKYGVRLNKNLLLDQVCGKIAIFTGKFGGSPQSELFPWYFYPTTISRKGHPVSTGIDPVRFRYVSSLDTVGASGIEKSIVMETSDKTRVLKAPARVGLGIVRNKPDFTRNNSPHQPVAVMLEGRFESFFKGRLAPKNEKGADYPLVEKGKPSKMMVVSDGDVIRNRVDERSGKFYKLGFSRYAGKRIYGNKDFLINSMNYLMGDAGLIDVRSRDITLRKLDSDKADDRRYFWQVTNVVLPVVLVLLFGFLQFMLRKRKYAVKSSAME